MGHCYVHFAFLFTLSYIKLYHVHCAMIVIHEMSRRLQNELLVFLWPLRAIAKLIDRCMLFYESPLPLALQ